MAGVLAMFAAAVGAIFGLPSTLVSDIVISGSSLATVDFSSSGTFLTAISSGTVEAGSWITPNGLASSAYTIRCHVNSGALTSGTVDTDLALSSSRSFQCARGSAGTTSANVTFTLKRSGVTVATSTMDLSAQTLT